MILVLCTTCGEALDSDKATSHTCKPVKFRWPNIKFAEDEKNKQIAELKAENERLRIALMELDRLAREALGG